MAQFLSAPRLALTLALSALLTDSATLAGGGGPLPQPGPQRPRPPAPPPSATR
ncbi:hypothetical protein ACFSC4_14900 [Deinococcus malanensis]|uniref:hypothetical protein n=1 Tax=Deinococcus malanensis TaxID=1706855 RepID=UPI00363E6A78